MGQDRTLKEMDRKGQDRAGQCTINRNSGVGHYWTGTVGQDGTGSWLHVEG